MLEIADVPPNVIVLRATGTLGKTDVIAAAEHAKVQLETHETIGIVADLTEMDGMSAQALVTDLAYQKEFFGDWHRFPRIAVVAEAGFWPMLSKAIGAVLPQIEVETFPPDAGAEAVAFASGVGRSPNL